MAMKQHIFCILILMYIVEKNFTSSLYISAILFGAVAFLCTVLQPYKVANGSITGLLIILSLLFGLSASIYENPQTTISIIEYSLS